MFLTKINWYPGRKELRTFAIVALIAATVAALLLSRFRGLGIQGVTIVISLGAAIFLSSFVSFKVTRVIYLGLILATLPIGLLISFFLLATFYFGILTPLAIIFRAIGRDRLRRKFDPDTDSYWITHPQPENRERYFNQF